MSKVKIMVVRGFTKEEIFGDDVPEELRDFTTPCQTHRPGQEFLLDSNEIPEGFCTWAYADIYRDIIHLSRGGDFPWVGKPGVMYSSCTDGRKTVVFRLERID
jgi:uncharacterized repeat protein (TIGR04076 family)